jgi:hypothetical protein
VYILYRKREREKKTLNTLNGTTIIIVDEKPIKIKDYVERKENEKKKERRHVDR